MASKGEREGISHDIGNLDRAFADFVCRLAGTGSSSLWLAAALTSNVTSRGSICLDLGSTAGEVAEMAARNADLQESADTPWRNADCWSAELHRFIVVVPPGGFAPLVLDRKGRLYLHRYWSYEKSLADRLLEMGAMTRTFADEGAVREGLDRLFPLAGQTSDPDWQRLAAWLCVTRNLTVIAGGPGTGKTTTVVKVLALLLMQPCQAPLRIALAAPTGKAAARLKEAISAVRDLLPLPLELVERIPAETVTLHRLLGAMPGMPSFRFNRENRLPYDLVVVDEASMVDLPLMAKLLDALPESCRLILLGDGNQLASVEAGAVFGDICHSRELGRFSAACRNDAGRVAGIALPATLHDGPSSLCDSLVMLQTSHRFGLESGIAVVSRLVNAGRGEEALQVMQGGRYRDISWHDMPHPSDLAGRLREKLLHGFGAYLVEDDPARCLERFSAFRLLSPFRKGPYGVHALNDIAERTLDLGLFNSKSHDSSWYGHRPLLIDSNDHQLHLFNGDIGIVLPTAAGERLAAWFPSSEGGVRQLSPLRLPPHETVFAMTVHKSQGSEFDTLILFLPEGNPDLLTRELVYTAITRAKSRVEIWGTPEVFIGAVSRRVQRSSGLAEHLWGDD